MTKQQHRPLDERMSAVETAVASLAESMQSFANRTERSIERLFQTFESHQAESYRRQLTPWGVVISSVAVAVTIIGAIGRSYISPLLVDNDYIKARIAVIEESVGRSRDRNAEQDVKHARVSGSLQDKLSEVETQFGWLVDAVNQDRAHRIRMEGIVWQEIYGEPLPLLHVNPIGPTKQRREQ